MAYRVSPELMDEMHKCRLKLRAFNTMDPTDEEGLTNAIAGIFGKSDHPVVIPPFYCDYGSHICRWPGSPAIRVVFSGHAGPGFTAKSPPLLETA